MIDHGDWVEIIDNYSYSPHPFGEVASTFNAMDECGSIVPWVTVKHTETRNKLGKPTYISYREEWVRALDEEETLVVKLGASL